MMWRMEEKSWVSAWIRHIVLYSWQLNPVRWLGDVSAAGYQVTDTEVRKNEILWEAELRDGLGWLILRSVVPDKWGMWLVFILFALTMWK